MKTGGIFAAFCAVLLCAGCVQELRNPDSEAVSGTSRVDIVLYAGGGAAQVKSAVGDGIVSDVPASDINIMVYDSNGRLFRSLYSKTASDLSVEVFAGDAYEIFAFANAGRFTAPVEMSGLQDLRYEISSIAGLSASGALPMCGRVSIAPSAPQEKILVTMKRMVSEIVLNFTPDPGLEVELVSVECVNVPMDMTPCREGSVPELRGDGDYATGDDMQCLMSGENVRLYMLEDASSDNDTPVPAGVPGSGELPGHLAYVDLKGHVRNSAGLVSADVDYRLVLDWKIIRNCRYTVNFTATEDGIHEDSYRVEVTDAELEMSRNRIALPVGGTDRIEVPVMEYTDVVFTSDSPDVVTVDASGNVSGLAEGTASVTVECPSLGTSAYCIVEVYNYERFTDYELELSDYFRAWGTLSLPTATADDPVYVSMAGDTLAVGGETGTSSGYARLDNGRHGVYYVPSAGRTVLHIWNGYTAGSSTLRVEQGRKMADIVLGDKEYPRYMVQAQEVNEISVAEDGSVTYFDLYLSDADGMCLFLEQFMMPDALARLFDQLRYDEFFWDYMDCLELYSTCGHDDFLDVEFSSTGWDDGGENYLYTGKMSLLKSDDTVPDEFFLTFHNGARGLEGSMPDTDVKITVGKAFCGQGYLGERYNFQMAPGSLYSDRIYLDVSVPADAEWEIRRYYPGMENEKPEDIWARASDEYTSLVGTPVRDAATGKYYLPLYEPQRFDADEFFANGSYILRGSVTNPSSGQVIYGYYTLDIILYVSILSEVEVEQTGLNSSRVYRGYVPLSIWSRKQYADFWRNMYSVPLHDHDTGLRRYANGLQYEYGPDYFDIPESINDPQASYAATIRALDSVFTRGTGDFDFYDPSGARVDELKIDRSNYRSADAFGYYHFVRQYDSGPDIENYLIEAYYGDFDKY